MTNQPNDEFWEKVKDYDPIWNSNASLLDSLRKSYVDGYKRALKETPTAKQEADPSGEFPKKIVLRGGFRNGEVYEYKGGIAFDAMYHTHDDGKVRCRWEMTKMLDEEGRLIYDYQGPIQSDD